MIYLIWLYLLNDELITYKPWTAEAYTTWFRIIYRCGRFNSFSRLLLVFWNPFRLIRILLRIIIWIRFWNINFLLSWVLSHCQELQKLIHFICSEHNNIITWFDRTMINLKDYPWASYAIPYVRPYSISYRYRYQTLSSPSHCPPDSQRPRGRHWTGHHHWQQLQA